MECTLAEPSIVWTPEAEYAAECPVLPQRECAVPVFRIRQELTH